jgi:TonB family protein
MLSLIVHGALVLLGLALYFVRLGPKATVEFEVIERPVEAPKALNISPPKAEPKPIEEKIQRKVFGVSRKAITDDSAAGEAVKQGNTVAVQPDNEKLKPNDADSLPIPTDEYLVTSMPSLLTEVRIDYPPEEKKKGIAGPVVMDLLIDAAGHVRDVNLISGPDPNLNAAAMKAAQGFKFKPAKVEAKAVAVRIRYTYRFVIER